MSDNCIFCKIAAGQIPAKKIYEDGEVIAFHDIHPIANVHFLIVPKQHVESLLSVTPANQALLGRLLTLAPQLAREHGLGDGFRTMINTGAKGGQSVFHLHLHVFGGGGKAEAMMAQLIQ
ncbi:histidine triad nucleotide-binding protein [Chitinimonas sp. BJB300]|uniref:histidine triad nucleotide-binding protein n=1 Tax=Chitinimonas sp. BJB300 TaxID=1559339 RepID=UPI000C0DF7DE|nr:histidine triad nucleotide-binding protein [Chitinimonas sp. BJB300]PHV11279.1 histidine triad nucleotide-binding protein [Chitinimonas sp. BJB300]TSJ91550.1 histidine triad nucleotide-binding protein [Chitinimonas sp. BJB300]